MFHGHVFADGNGNCNHQRCEDSETKCQNGIRVDVSRTQVWKGDAADACQHKKHSDHEFCLKDFIENKSENDRCENAICRKHGCDDTLVDASKPGIFECYDDADLKWWIKYCSNHKTNHIDPLNRPIFFFKVRKLLREKNPVFSFHLYSFNQLIC